MKILVAGSTGFVGRAFTKKMREHQFHTLVPVSKSEGIDLSLDEALDSLPICDVVVHLAGSVGVEKSWSEPSQFYKNNLQSTLNLLEYARRHSSKFIFLSSYLYGNVDLATDSPKISESAPVDYCNPYAGSKLLSEELVQHYRKLFNLETLVLRPFNIYGPGMPKSSLISSLMEQARMSEVVNLRGPVATRDYVFVDDVAAVLAAALELPCFPAEPINLGTGQGTSFADLMTALGTVMEKKMDFVVGAESRINDVSSCYSDPSRLKDVFGQIPFLDIENGLRRTLQEWE